MDNSSAPSCLETLREKGAMTGAALSSLCAEKGRGEPLAVLVDETLRDLDTEIGEASSLSLIYPGSPEGLDILRHTAAHVMAHAVRRLRPDTRLGIGPAIENGFYYDLGTGPIDEETLALIQEEMGRIVKENLPLIRRTVDIEEARALFKDEPYKLELAGEIASRGDMIIVYSQGDFVDLCAGPHLKSTGRLKFFQLLSTSGAFWRGDAANDQLTRVYGTAFFDKQALKDHIKLLEEREQRDHNKIGRRLEYFMTVPEIGKGLPLLMPKGARVKQLLQRFIEDEEERCGYELTMTPLMAKSELYEISGHWQHYKDGMFVLDAAGETMALRPMTCPFQFMIYKSRLRSYRDLPIRYSETTTLFRNESSGEMHGLIRVRQFTLSDAHIICTPEQLEPEFNGVLHLIEHIMKTIGIGGYWFRFSKWDPKKKDKYIDNPEAWEMSQNILKQCLDHNGLEYIEAEGEAAFYGPKLDIQLRNVYGKEDTIITIQFDFALPERFDMTYIDEGARAVRPMVIHRSSIGCYERTLAFLLEQYAGKLPYWLAPEQAVVMTINEASADYAHKLVTRLKEGGIRAHADTRTEKINRKVRDAQQEYIPLMITVGEKEVEAGTVSVRTLDGQVKYGVGVDAFVAEAVRANRERRLAFGLDSF